MRHWTEREKGSEELARSAGTDVGETKFIKPNYQPEDSVFENIEAIANQIYRVNEVLLDTEISD